MRRNVFGERSEAEGPGPWMGRAIQFRAMRKLGQRIAKLGKTGFPPARE
jgi:hypothetical protein